MALLLTRADVESALTMTDAIDAVEEAFRQQQLGTAQLPLRTPIRIPQHKGVVLFMPAYIGGMDALGMKVVTVYPENPSQHGLPTILATVLLNDPRTGQLIAMMDGAFLTAMRTGAASGVATKYLARPDAKVVGIFGAGIQAQTQLRAMCAVRPIVEARIYDPMPELVGKFCRDMSAALGIDVRAGDGCSRGGRGLRHHRHGVDEQDAGVRRPMGRARHAHQWDRLALPRRARSGLAHDPAQQGGRRSAQRGAWRRRAIWSRRSMPARSPPTTSTPTSARS